jgi:hypothetical protein
MNTRSTIFVATIAAATLLAGASRAHAAKAPVLFSWGGEKIIKVAAFPDTEDFKTRAGKHLDAGYRYKHISIFFIPIWNYGGTWCGYVGDADHYLDLSKTQLDALARSVGLSLPANPSLPLWESFGGKLAFGVLALLVLAGKMGSSDSEVTATQGRASHNAA